MSTLYTNNITNLTSGPPNIKGGITQVQSSHTTAVTEGTTSSTFSDIAGMSVSITPQSTNSNVLVMVNLCWGHNADPYGSCLVLRDSTELTKGDQLATANARRASFTLTRSQDAYRTQMASWQFLDTAISTTSQVVYKVQWAVYNNVQLYMNRPYSVDNDIYSISGTSSITVMEIGG